MSPALRRDDVLGGHTDRAPSNVIPAQAGTYASLGNGNISSAGRHLPKNVAPKLPARDHAGMIKLPSVYILASKPDGVLYIGVTSDLEGRMAQHDQGFLKGFTSRYGVKQLVYYEFHKSMDEAIRREKQLKEWRRAWKVRLIHSMNPEWRNLFNPATGEIAEGPADVARGKR